MKVDSARYGIIGAFVTKQFIKKDAELFSNYGPNYANVLGKSGNPLKVWYFELWKKFKEDNPDLTGHIKFFEDKSREMLKLYPDLF